MPSLCTAVVGRAFVSTAGAACVEVACEAEREVTVAGFPPGRGVSSGVVEPEEEDTDER